MLACVHAVRSAARVTDLMHRMGGTSGVYARSALERHFRDAQTVRHHGFLSESRLETVGQVYRARRFYARQGWSDVAELDDPAETAAGPIVVACRRYEKVVR